jgi:hypothetical protein
LKLEIKNLTKICKKCLLELPLESFRFSNYNYRLTCKKCLSKQFHEGLSDNYIKRKLKRRGLIINNETIQLQRQLIILKRNIKKIENEQRHY